MRAQVANALTPVFLSICLLAGALPLVPAAAENASGASSLREELQRLEPAVVAILAIDINGDAQQGTGFIVRPDGLVVTCEHVIRDAATVEVHWSSALSRPSEIATVVSQDDHADVALLQLSGYNYPTIPLAEVRDIRVGDAVATLGYPVGDILGLTDLSVTRGIVSALRRNDIGVVELVQTDAPIFMGNSGGPLFDLDLGGVVGVVRAKGIEELDGINFASGLEALLAAFPEVTTDTSGRLTTTQTSSAIVDTGEPDSQLPQLFDRMGFTNLSGYVEDAGIEPVPAWHPFLSQRLSLAEVETFLAEYPTHAQAHFLRGCLLQRSDPTAAEAAFAQAVALCPDDGLSARRLAELVAARGDLLLAAEWDARADALGFPVRN